jgi:hypothetical protein
MSGDEGFALIVFGIVALVGWTRWFLYVASATTIGSTSAQRAPLVVLPLLCAVVLFGILRTAASFDVRDSGLYLFFYMVMGAGWVAIARIALPMLGVSARLDAIERRNPAATVAVGGALLGLTLAFAGGNIGDGPGWWVVLFSSGLATLSLLGLWALIEAATHTSDAITIDRDLATGLRLAGFLIAAGLILGRGAAGNWVSADSTFRDFVRIAWPALPLALGAAVVDRVCRPTRDRPRPDPVLLGLLPALLFIALAVVYVIGVGRW